MEVAAAVSPEALMIVVLLEERVAVDVLLEAERPMQAAVPWAEVTTDLMDLALAATVDPEDLVVVAWLAERVAVEGLGLLLAADRLVQVRAEVTKDVVEVAAAVGPEELVVTEGLAAADELGRLLGVLVVEPWEEVTTVVAVAVSPELTAVVEERGTLTFGTLLHAAEA